MRTLGFLVFLCLVFLCLVFLCLVFLCLVFFRLVFVCLLIRGLGLLDQRTLAMKGKSHILSLLD
jgi:hypothetical protein